jgi:hypothetical protein
MLYTEAVQQSQVPANNNPDISTKLPAIAKLRITDLEHPMPKPTINDVRSPLALVCVLPLS